MHFLYYHPSISGENMDYIVLLKSGSDKWALERTSNSSFRPIMRDVNFVEKFGGSGFYDLPEFVEVDFSNSDMHMASLRNCMFFNCNFDDAHLTFTDLVDAYFVNCTFRRTCMRVSKIGNAKFEDCIFEECDMSYCSAEKTSFKGSSFTKTKMEHMSLVQTDFSDTKLDECFLYGISSWDLNLQNSVQRNLVITPDDMPNITVDNIELAQFLYLIINNQRLRDVINTITSKVVLILGNFSPERKAILDQIRELLRTQDVIPVIFDFEKPSTRNLTETVMTLASMSRFVIADLSCPRSIPHELASIARQLPSVRFYPIIDAGEKPFGMFDDYQSYPWIRPIKEYGEAQVDTIIAQIISEENSTRL
jgi:uncharacterized protein YjbI with pentapeptide repeats